MNLYSWNKCVYTYYRDDLLQNALNVVYRGFHKSDEYWQNVNKLDLKGNYRELKIYILVQVAQISNCSLVDIISYFVYNMGNASWKSWAFQERKEHKIFVVLVFIGR